MFGESLLSVYREVSLVKSIVIVMGRQLHWFRQLKTRKEKEDIRPPWGCRQRETSEKEGQVPEEHREDRFKFRKNTVRKDLSSGRTP